MTARPLIPQADWDRKRADEFGLPERYFGRSDGRVFGFIGRIGGALTGYVDHLLRLLINACGANPKNPWNDVDLVRRACKGLERVPDPGQRTRGVELVNEANELRERRHQLLHSTWAVIDDLGAAGNRPIRSSREVEYPDVSIEDMQQLVARLVAWIDEMDGSHGYVERLRIEMHRLESQQ